MKASQVFDELLSKLSDKSKVEVCAFAADAEDSPTHGKNVNLTGEAEDVFRDILRKVLLLGRPKERSDWVLRKYSPTYKSEENEIEWLPLESVPPVKQAVDRMNDRNGLSALDESDRDFMQSLSYWGMKSGATGRQVYAFRRFMRSAELSRNSRSALVLRNGTFDRATDRIFLFDHNVDCIVFAKYVFVLRKRDFRSMFEQMQEVFKSAKRAARDLSGMIPIANLDEFVEACGRDSRMADKMIAVQSRPYFKDLSYVKVKVVVDEFDLKIPVQNENGQPKFVFQQAPSERFKILKLVDDDYLRSTMTDLRYEVNSKIDQV